MQHVAVEPRNGELLLNQVGRLDLRAKPERGNLSQTKIGGPDSRLLHRQGRLPRICCKQGRAPRVPGRVRFEKHMDQAEGAEIAAARNLIRMSTFQKLKKTCK